MFQLAVRALQSIKKSSKQNFIFDMLYYIHTYIIGHYNTSDRIIDLVSQTTGSANNVIYLENA